jgi:hypothetical protein
MKQTKKDNARLKYINQLFYLFSQEEVLFGPLSSAVETLSAHLQPISEAFIQNLKGVCSTASIPKVIAISAVSQQRFAQIHLSEILEEKANMVGTAEDGTFSEAHAGIALERARAALEAELKSEEGTENATNAFIAFLNGVARSEWDDVEGAARELLRQSLVLVWGSFEVLCRDIFVAHLNLNPNDVLSVVLP